MARTIIACLPDEVDDIPGCCSGRPGVQCADTQSVCGSTACPDVQTDAVAGVSIMERKLVIT